MRSREGCEFVIINKDYRLVSCITGRPVMLSDEALDTELPVNIVSAKTRCKWIE